MKNWSPRYEAIFAVSLLLLEKQKGIHFWDTNGKEYIDFFAGAGALNYGHNPPKMKEKLLSYIADDGISHSLDMATKAKADFLKKFQKVILKPTQP